MEDMLKDAMDGRSDLLSQHTKEYKRRMWRICTRSFLDHVLRETLAVFHIFFRMFRWRLGLISSYFIPKIQAVGTAKLYEQNGQKKTPSRLEVQRFLTPWKSIFFLFAVHPGIHGCMT